jgi:hypothetical protein
VFFKNKEMLQSENENKRNFKEWKDAGENKSKRSISSTMKIIDIK